MLLKGHARMGSQLSGRYVRQDWPVRNPQSHGFLGWGIVTVTSCTFLLFECLETALLPKHGQFVLCSMAVGGEGAYGGLKQQSSALENRGGLRTKK